MKATYGSNRLMDDVIHYQYDKQGYPSPSGAYRLQK